MVPKFLTLLCIVCIVFIPAYAKHLHDDYYTMFGVDKMGGGYDTTTMNFLGLPIYDFTYDDKQIWENPVDHRLYLVPDQIYPEIWAESLFVNYTDVIHDEFDIQSLHKETVSWSYGFLDLGEASRTTIDYYEHYYCNDQSLFINQLILTFARLTLPTMIIPTGQMFNLAVSLLPNVYDATTKSKYTQFFNAYGTAVVDQAYLGGKMLLKNYYHKCIDEVVSKHDEYEEGSWSFIAISSHYDHTVIDDRLNKTFGMTPQINFTLIGGDIGIDMDHWEKWIPTVKTNMEIIKFSLIPIYQLINDPVKQSNIKIAMNDYDQNAKTNLQKAIDVFQGLDPHTFPDYCKPSFRRKH